MDVYEALYTTRAMRRVKPDPIPDADLHAIIEAATQAPSGGNIQPWHFLVITDKDQRSKLGELYHEAWWAKRRDAGIHGPEDIPETDRVARSAMRLADEIGEAPAIVLLLAAAQGPAAMGSVIPSVQNLLLAARALGLGGTITTLHADVDERVAGSVVFSTMECGSGLNDVKKSGEVFGVEDSPETRGNPRNRTDSRSKFKYSTNQNH